MNRTSGDFPSSEYEQHFYSAVSIVQVPKKASEWELLYLLYWVYIIHLRGRARGEEKNSLYLNREIAHRVRKNC